MCHNYSCFYLLLWHWKMNTQLVVMSHWYRFLRYLLAGMVWCVRGVQTINGDTYLMTLCIKWLKGTKVFTLHANLNIADATFFVYQHPAIPSINIGSTSREGNMYVCILICIQKDATLHSLFYLKLLYIFRVVPPHIITSANNCIYSI